MVSYSLMHQDTKCGIIAYDDTTDRVVSYHDQKTGCSPFLGNSDTAKIKKWWDMRAVPASRLTLKDMLREAGCTNARAYLAKNLALSMTDSYWICPDGMMLTYDEVKFTNLAAFHGGKVPYHHASSYSPNASLGGQMDKYWDLSGEVPVLVKESYRFFGQQAINEKFASMIHERQESSIPFVKYMVSSTWDNGLLCKCRAFTSDAAEFVPAYEVVESRKVTNGTSLYDAYLAICAERGIDRDVMQDYMDYQTLTDFVISNTDEHLLNFGILRNPNTMTYLGPAPIFDSGNSMFFDEMAKKPYTGAELLDRKITGFYEKEERILKKVRNRNIVRPDLLPSVREVKDFYESCHIPEWKADVISQNYGTKLRMLLEFQRGKTISLYAENHEVRGNHVPGDYRGGRPDGGVH